MFVSEWLIIEDIKKLHQKLHILFKRRSSISLWEIHDKSNMRTNQLVRIAWHRELRILMIEGFRWKCNCHTDHRFMVTEIDYTYLQLLIAVMLSTIMIENLTIGKNIEDILRDKHLKRFRKSQKLRKNLIFHHNCNRQLKRKWLKMDKDRIGKMMTMWTKLII